MTISMINKAKEAMLIFRLCFGSTVPSDSDHSEPNEPIDSSSDPGSPEEIPEDIVYELVAEREPYSVQPPYYDPFLEIEEALSPHTPDKDPDWPAPEVSYENNEQFVNYYNVLEKLGPQQLAGLSLAIARHVSPLVVDNELYYCLVEQVKRNIQCKMFNQPYDSISHLVTLVETSDNDGVFAIQHEALRAAYWAEQPDNQIRNLEYALNSAARAASRAGLKPDEFLSKIWDRYRCMFAFKDASTAVLE